MHTLTWAPRCYGWSQCLPLLTGPGCTRLEPPATQPPLQPVWPCGIDLAAGAFLNDRGTDQGPLGLTNASAPPS